MALIRRYGLYTAFAVFIIYMLYSLSFPYDDQPRKTGQGTRPRPKTFFNWDIVTIKHPLESLTPLPAGDPKALPKIQHNFGDEDPTAKKIRQARQAEVKKQFLKCWSNYRQKAWMHDEMAPISGQGKDPFGGWAATLIDAMDTLWIMKAKEEFTSAIRDIEKLNFGYTPAKTINVFETNIRHLGGLLAAYELSGDKRLLTKAKEMGEMLLHAFDTPNRMPITRWEFHEGGLGKDQTAHDNVLLAEIGSFSLEFTRLSEHTGDPKWYDAAFRITQVLERQQDSTKLPGMWPVVVNARKPDFTQDSAFTLASMSDSTYEYLVKQYALLGGRDDRYKKMYEKAMATAIKHTLYRPMTPENSDILVSGGVRVEGNKVYLDSEFQHLVCYAGGMLALGSKLFDNPEHLTIGRKLTDSCVWGYKATQSGIMPEKSHLFKCPSTTNCTWDEAAYKAEVHAKAELKNEKDPQQNIANLRLPKGFTAIDDRRYVLRPEAIESVFIMYRITGSQAWQAAAWDIFTAIQKHTDTDIGNSALQDVSADSPPRMDDMESFWLAETLKYFYLIFSEPHYMSLDDYVYNTEAHPLKIPKPKKE